MSWSSRSTRISLRPSGTRSSGSTGALAQAAATRAPSRQGPHEQVMRTRAAPAFPSPSSSTPAPLPAERGARKSCGGISAGTKVSELGSSEKRQVIRFVARKAIGESPAAPRVPSASTNSRRRGLPQIHVERIAPNDVTANHHRAVSPGQLGPTSLDCARREARFPRER